MKKVINNIIALLIIFSVSFICYKVVVYFNAQTNYLNELTKLVQLQNEYIYLILEQQ